jgi:cyclase
VSHRFGSCATVVAIDAFRTTDPTGTGTDTGTDTGTPNERWEVFINGGRQPTGLTVMDWTRHAQSLGAGEIVLNVMNADGTQSGYDIEMTRAVSRSVRIPVVASGGAGSPQDICQVLTEGHADAALAASIFHFGRYSIPQVKAYLNARGVTVRYRPS